MAEELREALIVLSERGTPAGAETVMERARGELGLPGSSLRPLRSGTRRRPRGLLVAVASAAVVLLAVGVIWFVGPFAGLEPAPPSPASPSPAVQPDVSPVVVDDPAADVLPTQEPAEEPSVLHAADVTWSRLDDRGGALGGEGDQFLNALVEGGPGYVAVGAECPGHCPFLTPQGRPSVGPGLDDWTAAVWTSGDGSSWDRVSPDEQLFGGDGDQVMIDIVRGGPGFVAVGWTDYGFFTGGMTATYGDYPQDVGLLDGEIWVSVDGVVWERIKDPDGVFTGPGNQRIEAVVAGGPGLVAVGFEGDNPESRLLGLRAAVWTSTDGYTWEKASLGNAEFGPLGTVIHDVAAGGPGLVAVGADYSVYADGDVSGCALQPRCAVPTVPGDPTRQRSYHSAAVWVSNDGRTWERVSPYDPAFGGLPESHPDIYTINGGPTSMESVAAYEGGLIAVGDGGWDRGIWLSPDGYTWNQVGEDDPDWTDWDSPRDLVVDGGRVAAVGIISNDGDLWDDETRRLGGDVAGAFYIEMAGVVVSDDRLVAVGTAVGPIGNFDAAIWIGAWSG